MGKAAERRKAKRLKFLASLAKRHPERFQEEWNRRFDSWLCEVHRRAGKLVDRYGNPVPSAFEVVKTARRLLAACGVKESTLEEHCSIDVLINECCKALAHSIDGRMYQLSVVRSRNPYAVTAMFRSRAGSMKSARLPTLNFEL